VTRWLEEAVPTSDVVSILHNDFKPDNVMASASDPSELVAVFDWDMCTRGDPLMDLGYLLIFVGNGAETTPSWWVGSEVRGSWYADFPTREELLARYHERTGHGVESIEWYRAFAFFKLMVILQQIYIRYLRGQTEDARFASFGARIQGLADEAREVVSLHA
jgi:aminoglycoside phosphotransferase (APT) family kinase protein